MSTTSKVLFIGGHLDGKFQHDPGNVIYKVRIPGPIKFEFRAEVTCQEELYHRALFNAGSHVIVVYVLNTIPNEEIFALMIKNYRPL